MTIVEKNIEEWTEELGLKARFKMEAKLEDAKKMLEKGFDANLITEITGLNKAEIDKLIKKLI